MRYHYRNQHGPRERCPVCNILVLTDRMGRHRQQHRQGVSLSNGYTCEVCHSTFGSNRARKAHMHRAHPIPGSYRVSQKVAEAIVVYRKTFNPRRQFINSLDVLFATERDAIYDIIKRELVAKKTLRYSIIPAALFERVTTTTTNRNGARTRKKLDLAVAELYLKTRSVTTDIGEHDNGRRFRLVYQDTAGMVASRLEDLTLAEGSGWTLKHFTQMILEIGKTAYIRGGGGGWQSFIHDQTEVASDCSTDTEEEEEEAERESDCEFIDDVCGGESELAEHAALFHSQQREEERDALKAFLARDEERSRRLKKSKADKQRRIKWEKRQLCISSSSSDEGEEEEVQEERRERDNSRSSSSSSSNCSDSDCYGEPGSRSFRTNTLLMREPRDGALTQEQISLLTAPYNSVELLDLSRYRQQEDDSMRGLCLYDALAMSVFLRRDAAARGVHPPDDAAMRRYSDEAKQFLDHCFPEHWVFSNADLRQVERLELWLRKERPQYFGDLAINVLGYEKKGSKQIPSWGNVYPLRISPFVIGSANVVNLQHLTFSVEEEDGDGKRKSVRCGHFMLIRKLEQYVRRRRKKNNLMGRLRPVCVRCMHTFYNEAALKTHQQYCIMFSDPVRTVMPKEGEKLSFRDHVRKSPLPVFGVGDFECVLLPVEEEQVKKESDDGEEEGEGEEEEEEEFDRRNPPYTVKERIHKPVAFSLLFVRLDPHEECGHSVLYEATRSSDDESKLMAMYFACLEEASELISAFQSRYTNVQRVLSELERETCDKVKVCWICEKPLPAKNYWAPRHREKTAEEIRRLMENKVVDHCHMYNCILGMAHYGCNLKRRRSYTTPLFFHNFRLVRYRRVFARGLITLSHFFYSSYDAAFVVHGMKTNKRISALCYNTQKFRTIRWGRFLHMDSMSFVNSSLSAIVDTMRRSGEDFPLLRMSKLYKGSPEKFELLKHKGVFAYSAHESLQEMRSQKHYPSREQFWDSLTERSIEEKEYQRGKELWDAFEFESVYHQLIQ